MTAAEFADRVRSAVADTPYTVSEETADGFILQLDVVDEQWRTLLGRRKMSKTWRWLVKVTGPRTYTVTDQIGAVEWEAGISAAGGVPRPRLRFEAMSFRGTAVEVSRRTTWAITDDGTFGPVVDYAFDSREGRDMIDAVARSLGLQKRMNASAMVGLVVAAVVVASLVIAGLWLLVTRIF